MNSGRYLYSGAANKNIKSAKKVSVSNYLNVMKIKLFYYKYRNLN